MIFNGYFSFWVFGLHASLSLPVFVSSMQPRTVMILQPLCSDGIFTTTYASGVEALFCAGFLGEPRRGLCHLHPPGMWYKSS